MGKCVRGSGSFAARETGGTPPGARAPFSKIWFARATVFLSASLLALTRSSFLSAGFGRSRRGVWGRGRGVGEGGANFNRGSDLASGAAIAGEHTHRARPCPGRGSRAGAFAGTRSIPCRSPRPSPRRSSRTASRTPCRAVWPGRVQIRPGRARLRNETARGAPARFFKAASDPPTETARRRVASSASARRRGLSFFGRGSRDGGTLHRRARREHRATALARAHTASTVPRAKRRRRCARANALRADAPSPPFDVTFFPERPQRATKPLPR